MLMIFALSLVLAVRVDTFMGHTQQLRENQKIRKKYHDFSLNKIKLRVGEKIIVLQSTQSYSFFFFIIVK